MSKIWSQQFHQFRSVGFSLLLTLLCSCASAPDPSAWLPASEMPADIAMNKDAGHLQKLYVPLHLENGKELLLAVDTGSTATTLDRSLEPMLEPYHIGRTKNVNFAWWQTNLDAGVYEAPKLYSGNVRLLTGDVIFTADLSRIVDPPVVGILGMDCLRHYCVQSDFAAGKVRFLNPQQAKSAQSGESFSLTFSDGRPVVHAGFWGRRTAWCIDTGCEDDAALTPKRFQRMVRELDKEDSAGACLKKTATNYVGMTDREAFCREVVFNGQACTNFVLRESPGENLLGLRFLARHLVLMNFPQKILYLQRRTDEPFADEDIVGEGMDDPFLAEVDQFLFKLKASGALPGWSKDEHGQVFLDLHEKVSETYPISRTVIATKNNDATKYHYLVTRTSKDDGWKLQRAWRTDAKGNVADEWPAK